MQVSTHHSVQSSWLMMLVLCAGLASTAGWAGSQQQVIELQFEELSNSSEDDNLITGFMPGLNPAGFPLPSPVTIEKLLPVTGSDAYSSLILHGPPIQDYIV